VSGRRGLGLLETLVALATAAVLLAALAGVVAGAARVRARATAAAERAGTGRTVLLRLGAELTAAVAADDPAAPERFVVGGETPGGGARLRFAIAGDEPRLVAYAVERGALVRRSASRFAPPDAGEPPPVALVDGVRALGIRCFDGHEWTTTWLRPGLPRAVELSLDLDDGPPLQTTLALPLGTGS
jgi:type II secretory pathway component PulJ